MTSYTIIGSSGFIGKNISKFLHDKNEAVLEINRMLPPPDVPLGTVVYCAGFGDCREPQKVLDANLTYLINIVNSCSFERLFYISSTRLYLDNADGSENADLMISNADKRSVFNLTKLMVERIFHEDPRIISLRLSNVYGDAFKSPLFLPSIIRDAIVNGKVNMFTSKDYTKDYINVNDVCSAIYLLSKLADTSHNIYNIASSINVPAGSILDEMSKYIDFDIDWLSSGNMEVYPRISIERLCDEINFQPSYVLDDIKGMAALFKKNAAIL